MLSATAGAMALGLIPAGLLAQRFRPKPAMLSAIVSGALCSLLCAAAPDYPTLLALRALLGLYLAGLPAVASAWLADLVGWRVAFAGLGPLGVISAFEFWRSLPASRRHRPRPLHPRHAFADLLSVFTEPGLLPLFGLDLLLTLSSALPAIVVGVALFTFGFLALLWLGCVAIAARLARVHAVILRAVAG